MEILFFSATDGKWGRESRPLSLRIDPHGPPKVRTPPGVSPLSYTNGVKVLSPT